MLGKAMVGEAVAPQSHEINGLERRCGKERPIDVKGDFRAPPAPSRPINTGRPVVAGLGHAGAV